METIRSNKKLFYLIFLVAESALLAISTHIKNGTVSNWALFIASMVIVFILSLPFLILNRYSRNSKKRIVARSIVDGVLIWCYISVLPLTLINISQFYQYGLIFWVIQLLIGAHFIYKFKLPKGFAIIALFFSALANLYFLVYGFVKIAKK